MGVPMKSIAVTIPFLTLVLLTSSFPLTVSAQSSSDIRIKAANLDDCLQKGTDWIRKGYDLNAVNQYCALRYDLYAFCKERPLTSQESSNVAMSIIMVPIEVGPTVRVSKQDLERMRASLEATTATNP